jgi:hypothetical protein
VPSYPDVGDASIVADAIIVVIDSIVGGVYIQAYGY